MAAPAFIPLTVGSIVQSKGSRYKITHVLNAASVLAVNVETEERLALNADEISAPSIEPDASTTAAVSPTRDLEEIPEENWTQARHRYEIIKPLLADPYRTEQKVRNAATAAKIHFTTLYEWLRLYSDSGYLSSLIPQKRGRKTGAKLISPEQEAIIEAAIARVYLHKQRPKINAVIEDVLLSCRTAKIEAPHPNTIRNRIAALPAKEVLRGRGMQEKARNKFEPVQSSFPNAEFPLAVVQIDHTELDVMVVEEQTRMSMGRPWITVAIDVYSRMIVGIYISMEKPSSVAVGICISRAMLPKHEYLTDLEVPGEWRVWGKMRKIYVDNAKEFRSNTLKLACLQYGIDLEMRPVMTPHYGGHIERCMGTTSNEIRKVPGATFSSITERKGYDSEKEAAMTLPELEQHVVDFIVNVYHQRIHSGLRMSPTRKWQLGVLGDRHSPGVGIPPPPADPLRLRLDFMPFEKRSVQTYGIVIDNVNYYHEVLNGWINAADPEDPKRKREFVVKRDPRDISSVYFFDPEDRQYYKIPYRNTAFPPISLWELRAAQQRLKQEGKQDVNEDAIFESIVRGRKRIEAAVHNSKAARRQSHRTQAVQKTAIAVSMQKPAPESRVPELTSELFDDLDIFNQPITPFEELAMKP